MTFPAKAPVCIPEGGTPIKRLLEELKLITVIDHLQFIHAEPESTLNPKPQTGDQKKS